MSSTSALTPAIIIHIATASSALLLGPVALMLRKGSLGHRAIGYAWITAMLAAALSALFIRDLELPNIGGYTPIHLFVLLTFWAIANAIWAIAHGQIRRHRSSMWGAYLGGCVTAGALALLPQRYLGHLLWHQWLGWA
ncbi:MAG TPA: DUF2306 domain-containing protein [Roseateles sp.]|nr:DUF2306 domain-containing protein [Roseateles sp.]